ncbi:MAG: hypothetical protein LBF97_05610, partial [Elusimicrobiota bacterium]|nr:hypothetical protein [Elusimicrobiota bacterium]
MASYEYAQSRLGNLVSEEVKNAAADIFYKADGTLGTEALLYKNRVPFRDSKGVVTDGKYVYAKDQARPDRSVVRPTTKPFPG